MPITNNTQPVISTRSQWQVNYNNHLNTLSQSGSSKKDQVKADAQLATNAIYDAAHGQNSATFESAKTAVSKVLKDDPNDANVKLISKDLDALLAVAKFNDTYLSLSQGHQSVNVETNAAALNARTALTAAGAGGDTDELVLNAHNATGAESPFYGTIYA